VRGKGEGRADFAEFGKKGNQTTSRLKREKEKGGPLRRKKRIEKPISEREKEMRESPYP